MSNSFGEKPTPTEVVTDTPVTITGDFPLGPAEETPIEGVWRGVVVNSAVEEREIDFASQGKVLTIAGTTLPELQRSIHAWAIRKEWRGENAETQRTIGDDIALITSELSEALEAFRLHGSPSPVWYTYTVEVDGVKFKDLTFDQLQVLLDCEDGAETMDAIEELNLKPKPEGVGPELADAVIRILDTCEEHGLNLLHFIMEKMAHNDTREVRHGGMHL